MSKKAIAIISDDHAGLILASLLERQGHAITLIDTGDNFHRQKYHARHSVPYYPATDEMQAALTAISPLFDQPIVDQKIELPPLTYENGSLKPFVGFGETKSPAVHALSLYNQSERLELNLPLEEKMEDLISALKGKVLTYSELTRFDFTGPSIEKLVINGAQEIFADLFVFMNSPREFIHLLPTDHNHLGVRTRGRIMKTPIWARVTLQMEHTTPLYDGRNLLFLAPGTGDQTPCVGICLQESSPEGTPRYLSVWETYIDNDMSEDAEHVSTQIKTMRRLIRRAFPHLEEKPREVLTVTPEAAADFSWIHEQNDIAEIANNLIISPTLASAYPGMARCVHAAYRAL